MGLQSALSTALTGMNAAETMIDVAGNNVANSQTVGFKESTVNFATQFLQTISIGSAPSEGNGGTNPRQIGLGVKVAEITPDFTQGTIEISSNPLDVAIQGDGFLVVEGSQGERLFTRNGQLKTNQNNEVVTVTGNRVLGYNADNGTIVEDLEPLIIPIGGSVVNKITENVYFNGALDPNSDVGVGRIITSSVFSNGAVEVPDETAFDLSNFAETPSIDMSAAAYAGTTANPGPAAGLYSYRVTFVDAAGNETAGSSALSVDATAGGGNEIQLSGLPPADGTNFVDRRVYRTLVGGTGDYFLVGNIGDATTTTFTDGVVDGSLGSALDTDALDEGAYSYYVTFYNPTDQIETRPTSLIGTIPIDSPNRRIRISDIPQPVDAGFTEIRLYRSLSDDASTHYRIASLAVGTTTYMDSDSDLDISGNEEVDLDGPKITTGTSLFNVVLRSGSDYDNLFSEAGTLRFVGTKGDSDLPAKELAVDSSTTVLDWLDFMTEALGIDASVGDGASVTVLNGQVVVQSNAGERNAIDIDPSAFVFTPTSTGLNESVVIPFSETQAAVGQGSSTEIIAYDSLGIPVTVRITTALEEKTSSNTVWRWYATSGDNQEGTGSVNTVVGTGLITFDEDGNYVPNSNNTTVVIDRNETASQSPLSFDLQFGNVSGKFQDTNQLNFASQDGFAAGVLTNFSITESGEIRGVYSNGVGQTLGQIRMVRFTNNAGLQQVGNNLYSLGVNSGEPQYGNPGDAGLGALTAGAVELSNTDIGQNLIELILASTQYRGGARVITSVQQLLDELLNLRR